MPLTFRQAARLAALALSLGVLAGCQGIMGDSSNSQVRVIDVSPKPPISTSTRTVVPSLTA